MLTRLAVAMLLVITGVVVPSSVDAAPSAATSLSTAARARASLHASYKVSASGKVQVSVSSNAPKVKVWYRTAKNKSRSTTLTLHKGRAAKTLSKGSKKIYAQANATKKLRTSPKLRVWLYTAKPVIVPTAPATAVPTPTLTVAATPTAAPTSTISVPPVAPPTTSASASPPTTNPPTPRPSNSSVTPLPSGTTVTPRPSVTTVTPRPSGTTVTPRPTVSSPSPSASQTVGKCSAGSIEFTFDDGPGAGTAAVLDILKSKGVTATFFLIGANVVKYPALVSREVAEGHAVGNHTWSHPDLLRLTTAQITAELNDTSEAIENASGVRPLLWRPPESRHNSSIDQIAKSAGLTLKMFDIDSYDWDNTTAEQVRAKVLNEAHKGAVVDFHDIHQNVVQALPQLIDDLRARGYCP